MQAGSSCSLLTSRCWSLSWSSQNSSALCSVLFISSWESPKFMIHKTNSFRCVFVFSKDVMICECSVTHTGTVNQVPICGLVGEFTCSVWNFLVTVHFYFWTVYKYIFKWLWHIHECPQHVKVELTAGGTKPLSLWELPCRSFLDSVLYLQLLKV